MGNEYALLFAAATAFEFAYTSWARAAGRGRIWATGAWSVLTAGLGLVGIKGALELPMGWIPYLGGIGVGAISSALLGARADRAAAT